jgi:hypothetical protein
MPCSQGSHNAPKTRQPHKHQKYRQEITKNVTDSYNQSKICVYLQDYKDKKDWEC